jgi:hypothetical protein
MIIPGYRTCRVVYVSSTEEMSEGVEVLTRGARDVGCKSSGACERRAAVAGAEDPRSLAAAGGRHAWSRTESCEGEVSVLSILSQQSP